MTNNVMLPWEEWKIEKLLGRGSFGEVYQVIRDEIGTEMRAAVKIIRIPMDESEMERLEDSGISAQSYLDGLVTDIANEIVLMQTLKGAPNIVGIDDYKIVKSQERIQWTIYIRMELLTDLNRYRRTHPLSYKQVLQLGCDLCNALEICQQKKIIHRDIKPSNIFVSPYGEYKLGDFGISKHTENTQSAFSTRKGTISYMAPEIYRGEKYGYSIDLYSLGIVLYQMANNGRLPFYPSIGQNVLPEDAEQAMKKRYMGIPFPDPAHGGKELGDILRKACHIDPKQRYNSPAEMHVALKKLLNHNEPVRDFAEEEKTVLLQNVPKKEEKSRQSEREPHNHYKTIILAVVALLGIGGAGISFYMSSHRNIKDERAIATEKVTETKTEKITEEETKATERQTERATETEIEETEQQTEKIKKAVTHVTAEEESKNEIEDVSEANYETTLETEFIVDPPVYDASEYVILGDYKGLTVEVDPVEVTDEQVMDQIASETKQTFTEGTVESGDIVNIDYVGKMDGEEFDGGSAEGYDLEIGSCTFIDGFEDGVIGMRVGETKDLNLKFPKDYHSEDLAGKDVVFTVTVNYISRIPALTDEVYQKMTREELEYQAKESQKSDVQQKLLQTAYENATIKGYPEENLQYTMKRATDYYEWLASTYGMTLDEYLTNYGMTQDQFKEQIQPVAEEALGEEMTLLAIAKEENIEISDEEYKDGLARYAETQGLDDPSKLKESYDENYIRNSLLQEKVLDFLYENAIIEEVQ